MTIKEWILYLNGRLKAMEEAYNSLNTKLDEIKDIVTTLKNVELGNWEIKDNQMIFYDLNGDEIARYDLLDKEGNPTDMYVFKRIKK